MKTLLTDSPQLAAEFIRRHEVVAFPTETVYGLGANVFSEAAVSKIFAAKGRPTDNPLIVHLAELAQLAEVAREITSSAQQFINAFFPGPLTVIVPKREAVSPLVTAGLDTVGVRMPRHSVAQEFLKACGVPVCAPSANLSGKPSPTTWDAVNTDLAGRISCILKGDQTEVGLESTVVDCTGETPVVLRAGAITLEQLRRVIAETQLAKANAVTLPKSPGMKYRHYAPQAKVVLVNNADETDLSANAAWIGLVAHPQAAMMKLHRVCRSVDEYAHALFLFFRDCDAAGVATIYCQPVEETGLGLALMDRLRRAGEQHHL